MIAKPIQQPGLVIRSAMTPATGTVSLSRELDLLPSHIPHSIIFHGSASFETPGGIIMCPPVSENVPPLPQMDDGQVTKTTPYSQSSDTFEGTEQPVKIPSIPLVQDDVSQEKERTTAYPSGQNAESSSSDTLGVQPVVNDNEDKPDQDGIPEEDQTPDNENSDPLNNPPIMQLYTIPLKTVKRLMRPTSTSTAAAMTTRSVRSASSVVSKNQPFIKRSTALLPAIDPDKFSVDRVLRLLDPPCLIFDPHTGEPKESEHHGERVTATASSKKQSLPLNQAIKRLQKAIIDPTSFSQQQRPHTTKTPGRIRDVITAPRRHDDDLGPTMPPHASRQSARITRHAADNGISSIKNKSSIEVVVSSCSEDDGGILNGNLSITSPPTMPRDSRSHTGKKSTRGLSCVSPWPEPNGLRYRNLDISCLMPKKEDDQQSLGAVVLPSVSPFSRAGTSHSIKRIHSSQKPSLSSKSSTSHQKKKHVPIDCHMSLSRVVQIRTRPKKISLKEAEFFQQNFVSVAPTLNTMMQLAYNTTFDKQKRRCYEQAVDRVTRARAELELGRMVVKEKREARIRRPFSSWKPLPPSH